MLMLHVGKVQGNALRGRVGGGQLVNMEEEDDIFFRFYPQFGLLADIRPMDNLYFGISVDAGNTLSVSAGDVYDWESTSTSAGYQVGIGYQFPFGHLRAQLIGLNSGVQDSFLFRSGRPLQVAFAYTDIYNLILEVSGRYPLRALHSSPASVTMAAEYTYERISMMGRFTFMHYPEIKNLDGWLEENGQNRFKLGSVIKYTINFPLFLGLELSYASDNPLTPAIDDLFQIAPYLGFRYGRGEFRIGVYWQQGFKDDKPRYVWEIPLLFEARFF
jgi:hypothetical protein